MFVLPNFLIIFSRSIFYRLPLSRGNLLLWHGSEFHLRLWGGQYSRRWYSDLLRGWSDCFSAPSQVEFTCGDPLYMVENEELVASVLPPHV